ncbi:MAG TPA: hypothetical protein VJB63_00360 [Patescibacteria group bacterium]|nr:hypothetical protein [Patescibacteria group bacterium]
MNETILIPQNTIERPPVKLTLAKTTNVHEALGFIWKIPFEKEYNDWTNRISKFIEEYSGNWKLIYIYDNEGTNSGFCIISDSKGKLKKWSKKFQSAGWIQTPVNINTSVQFTYFMFFPKNAHVVLEQKQSK